MAERLTPSSVTMPKRPRGRPRKDGTPPRQASAAPAVQSDALRRGRGSNVSDETRLEFLERGRLAYLEADRKKQDYQSAYRIYSTIIKEARKCGASEIAWTLEAMRRDPLEVEREIEERIRMARLAEIPIGTQFEMFEATKVQLAMAGDAKLADVSPPTQISAQAAVSPPRDPVPGPDDDEPEDDEPDDHEGEKEETPQAAKPGNEILEHNDDDANAFLQGQRAFLLGRASNANPYDNSSTMHNAWTRGWKTKEMAMHQ